MKKIKVVAAVIYNECNEIFITQRKDNNFFGKWEFPGGKIEEGESNVEALRREIKEELNLEIYNEIFLISTQYQYPDFILDMDVYKAYIKKGNLELNVHLDYKWVKKEELNKIDWVPADIEVATAIINE